MPTPIYELCDAYVENATQLDPILATFVGISGHDAEITDFSPEGIAARAELDRRTLATLRGLEPQHERDHIAAGLMAERLETNLALVDAGETLRSLRILGSPFQHVRQVFDLMPRATETDWETVATRMEQVPAGLAGLRSALGEAVARQNPPARRQVLACARQGETWAGLGEHPAFFGSYVEAYGGANAQLAARLDAAAATASDAYAETAGWLRDVLAPVAGSADAAGPERYQLAARQFLGSTIDSSETYSWGWSEVHRLEAEMESVAAEIVPGAAVGEVIDILQSDPKRVVNGEDALRAFLQDLMDRTIAELDGIHFDIPGPLKRIEAMIAPPGGAAAPHYTRPSEDLSRPGRTWYPTLGKTSFPLWGEISTCYHEGVPGHHLQVGQVCYLRDELPRYTRMAFLSGHGEGWALYAERLMDELGRFERPDYRLGYLRSQLLRAIRVVVDVGMHLELKIPGDEAFHPGERWTPQLGEELLYERSWFPRDFMASELDRYLGMPAQAISYKVGERAWLTAREQARRTAGGAFDLKAFHSRALGLGPIGLDQLVAECGRSPDGSTAR